METKIQELNKKVESHQPQMDQIFSEIEKVIVGQRYLLERLLMGILIDGHILVEGVPGLAKTTAVKTFAEIIKASFQRIQFTPDLLPADLLGTQIYNPKTQDFTVKRGPLFSQIILADEINRAPAKVQSALLECMQEKQITIGEETFKLEEPFIVLATQNPIEQEGTYPLPEAQVDRFMLKLKVDYPSRQEELAIMDRVANKKPADLNAILDPASVLSLRELIRGLYVDPKINEYIVNIVFATRDAKPLGIDLERYISYGGSPRASIYLNLISKAYAFLQGRGFVVPQDVKTMAADVLRHRIILSYEAEAEGLTSDEIIKRLLNQVEVP